VVGRRVLPPYGKAEGGRALRAEIVAVGTELLLGQIPNTNAQKISSALASAGVDVLWHSVVGDNHERIEDAVRRALSRAGAVILTGGLGPTPDDITSEAVARALGLPLERDARLAATIRSIFERLGRAMPEDNLKQADLPRGARPIEPEGTAPGFYVEHGSSILFALPGVPWEMEGMLATTVLPVLRERAGDAVTVSSQILVVGLGESHTHERIEDLVAAQTNPTIAFLAGGGQVRVRVTAKAASTDDALALIAPVEAAIRERLEGSAVEGEGAQLTDIVGELLRLRAATVATAESLTGGLLGAELSRVPGASDYFLGSLVCYSTTAKRDVAGLSEAILNGPGPVSEEAAGGLARAAARIYDADLGLSTTGVAGPSEHDGKPAGTIFVGAAYGARTEVRKVPGYGDRDNVRAIAVTCALDLGRRMLLEP
jgi:nicotinamide-nucleotide amidase